MKIKNILFLYIIFLLFNIHSYLNAHDSKVVLITGGAGFIGSNFLKYMFNKHPDYHFIVLDALTYAGNIDNIPEYVRCSSNFEFFQDSITNVPLVNTLMSRAHFVVHFAAETHVENSIKEPGKFFESNVIGSQVMMDALVKNPNVERFIHISSSEVYGTAIQEAMTEEHPLNPRSPYAAAKAGADRLVYAYGCTFDVPVVIIRPFNNYGPGQHTEKVIPHFIKCACDKESLPIHGEGEARRDWLYVEDHCEALDTLLHINDFNTVKHHVINLGTGRSLSVIDVAHSILQYFDTLQEDAIRYVNDRPGQVACHIASTEKAYNLLGWKAKTSFEEGIRKTINWYRNTDIVTKK